jgi:hypothetical protein
MARAPYGPHIVTRIRIRILVVKGMVVGSPTTARATPHMRVRAGWFWSPHWATRSEFPFRRRISALCAHIGDSGRACTLPLGVGAPHRIPRAASGGNAPCALWFLTRRGYLHPGPTALDCYLRDGPLSAALIRTLVVVTVISAEGPARFLAPLEPDCLLGHVSGEPICTDVDGCSAL